MKPKELKLATLWLTIALLGCMSVNAQPVDAALIAITPGEIRWMDFPGIPGRKIANVQNSLQTPGAYVVRIMLPAGSRLPPHWHSVADSITVISGTFYLGMGAKAEESMAKAFPVGSAIVIPPKLTHFGYVKEDTVLQLQGVGPYDTSPASELPK